MSATEERKMGEDGWRERERDRENERVSDRLKERQGVNVHV